MLLRSVLKHTAIGMVFLSLAAFLFFAPSPALASHGLCGQHNTYASDSWSPASGVYVSITSVACGVGRPTFSSSHHEVQCSSSGSFSFGSGSYSFEGRKANWQLAYLDTFSTSGTCPNDSKDYGAQAAKFIFTDFSLTVTYVPTGETRTLSASASDCADRFCPE